MCEAFCNDLYFKYPNPAPDQKNWQNAISKHDTEVILRMYNKNINVDELEKYILELERKSSTFEKPPSLRSMRKI